MQSAATSSPSASSSSAAAAASDAPITSADYHTHQHMQVLRARHREQSAAAAANRQPQQLSQFHNTGMMKKAQPLTVRSSADRLRKLKEQRDEANNAMRVTAAARAEAAAAAAAAGGESARGHDASTSRNKTKKHKALSEAAVSAANVKAIRRLDQRILELQRDQEHAVFAQISPRMSRLSRRDEDDEEGGDSSNISDKSGGGDVVDPYQPQWPTTLADSGPVVEPLSYSYQMIARRNFETAPLWCAICNEPLSESNYLLHFSRKDHCLLDQHFEQIVEWHRTWSADDLLCGGRIERAFGRDVSAADLLSRCHAHFAEQERLRRVEINAMTAFLMERELIGPTTGAMGIATKGSIFGVFLSAHMILHLIVPPAVLHMVPRSNIEHCSSIEDFTSATYNHETFHDMLGWQSLLYDFMPPNQQQQKEPLTVGAKSNIVRNVLSQLKAAVMENEEVEFASLKCIVLDAQQRDQQSDTFRTSQNKKTSAGGCAPELDDESAEDCIEHDLQFVSEHARRTLQASLDAAANVVAEKQRRSLLVSSLEDRVAASHLQQGAAARRRLQSVNSDTPSQEQYVSVADVGAPTAAATATAGASSSSTPDDEFLPLPIRAQAAETLMAVLGRAIVADLIHCRISEYMVRSEPTWRTHGEMEQVLPRPLLPEPKVRVTMSARPEVELRPWLPHNDN